MDPLAFAAAFKMAPSQPLLQADWGQVPYEAGAYILFARETEFVYPCGASSIFYIGRRDTLRRRLRQHRNKTREAKSNRRKLFYALPHEYGAAFDSQFTFILAEDSCHEVALELLLFAIFATRLRALPVANSTGSRRTMQQVLDAMERISIPSPAADEDQPPGRLS
jgi:hypothetical protein